MLGASSSMPVRSDRTPLRGWFAWGLAALAFGYAFFQRVTPSVMVDELMREFAVGAAVLGNLSALYFYAYAGLQVPVGMMLDRWGPRRMLTVAALIAGVGSVLFGIAGSIEEAYLGRFLVGVGSSVGFVASMKLAATWFPTHRFALLSGTAMFVAMAGGVAGQAPLAAAVEDFGWRAVLVAAAALAAVLAIANWAVVRDRPAGVATPAITTTAWADLGATLRRRQNWFMFAYCGLMSAPLLAYATLWGVPYLMEAFAISRTEAALSTSFMLIGGAVGGPLTGWASDAMRRRKPPMIAAAAMATLLWLVMLFGPELSLTATRALLVITGMATGGMVVSYAAAREHSPSHLAGAAVGLVNMAAVGGGALLQPIVGLLLDFNWNGEMLEGARVYDVGTYHAALTTLPICTIVALCAALLIRETGCLPLEEREAASGA